MWSPVSSGTCHAEAMKTIPETVSELAQTKTNQVVYTFLRNDETEWCSLTYSSIHNQATSIASQLALCTRPGDRVLLLFPTGPNFICAFIACLYAGVIAVPAPLPRARRRDERLRSIINDCSPALTLTLREIVNKGLGVDQLGKVICSDCIPAGVDAAIDRAGRNNPVAFLQYTSGSTTTPRGVVVTHENIAHNAACLKEASEYQDDTIAVTWLPHFHDMGLVEGLLQPVLHGFRSYILSPAQFLQRPSRWLSAISRYKATHSGAPNFAYDLCVRSIDVTDAGKLNLSSWQLAYNGAEPVNHSTIESFCARFGSSGFKAESFHPSYGLAEATLVVASSFKGKGPNFLTLDAAKLQDGKIQEPRPGAASVTLVSSGRALLDTRLLVVNPKQRTPLREDEVGEIWIASKSIAEGYWRAGADKNCAFGRYVTQSGPFKGPYFATGDLGFIHNDELFITGRLKEVIIVNGRNHYPQDIENTVKEIISDTGYLGVAAFAFLDRHVEGVGVLIECNRRGIRCLENEGASNWTHSLLVKVKSRIAEIHDLQLGFLALLKPGSIPKTTSGKVRRTECSNRYASRDLKPLWEWARG